MGAVKGLFTGKSIEIPAVKGLDFSIRQGEAVGLIGENGAGKSTTVKMLTGILTPSSGSVKVLGLTPAKEREKLALQIGVVFGQKAAGSSGTLRSAKALICSGPCTRSLTAPSKSPPKKPSTCWN